MKAYVQFKTSKKLKIISVFAVPQDTKAYPNQAEIDVTDQRYIDFENAFPGTLPEPH